VTRRGAGAGVAVGIAAALLFGWGLGTPDLWTPDEPRYAQVAEELRRHPRGAVDLVLLRLGGEVYTQKPPLWFWLAALAGAPAERVTEWAARLPSAAAGVATVLLVWRFGARAFGPPAGAIAAAVLATSFRFAFTARRAQLDVLLTLFVTAALFAFFTGGRAPGRGRVALVHAAVGLAVLTKGPVGLLLPLLAAAAFAAWERDPGLLRRWCPPWAPALSVAPGLLWILAAVAAAPAGFAEEAIGENLFGRFFTGTSHARPWHYYLHQLPIQFLPGTLLWPAALRTGRRVLRGEGGGEDARTWRFLLAWSAAVLVFFTLSAGKRGVYVLPAFPALALLCGDALARLARTASDLPRALRGAAALAAGAVALAGAAILLLPDVVSALTEGVRIPRAAGAALLLAAAAGTLAWRRAARAGRPARARLGVLFAAVWACELVVLVGALPALDPEKSPRPLALAAAARARPGAPIGLFGARSLAGGLVYYGGRRVETLSSPESVERFLAEGGRVVVIEAKDLPALERTVPVRVRERLRNPRRAFLVVEARPRAAAPPSPDADAAARRSGAGTRRAGAF